MPSSNGVGTLFVGVVESDKTRKFSVLFRAPLDLSISDPTRGLASGRSALFPIYPRPAAPGCEWLKWGGLEMRTEGPADVAPPMVGGGRLRSRVGRAAADGFNPRRLTPGFGEAIVCGCVGDRCRRWEPRSAPDPNRERVAPAIAIDCERGRNRRSIVAACATVFCSNRTAAGRRLSSVLS